MSMKRGSLLVFGILFFIGLVYSASFSDISLGDFDDGTYFNTTHNSTAVILNVSNLSGEYTSEIFDSGALVTFGNFSLERDIPAREFLFTVDNIADIHKFSTDGSINWTLVKDDYNAGNGNSATEIVSNSSNGLFILDGQDVWYSINSGANWTLINDNYNGGESNNGIVFLVDNNDSLFIIEGDQDVWSSNNSGINFTKVSVDFNAGNGNLKGITVNSSNALFAGDAQADVWYSIDSGVTWVLAKDDYNGGNGNDVTAMAINSTDGLFILHNQDLWSSVDSGVTWTLANDDFNVGSSSSGQVLHIDSDDFIYVIDGAEDVYVSSDSGLTFNLNTSNYNAGNGNVAGLTSIIQNTSLEFHVRNCSSVDCSDASFIGPDGTVDTFYVNLTNQLGRGGRYFQYKAYFDSDDVSITPHLFNVSIEYHIVDGNNPNLTILSPGNQTYTSNTILVNLSASDANLDTIWFYDGVINTTYTSEVNYIFSEGSTTLFAYANDSVNNLNFTNVTFFVDSVVPVITIDHPVDVIYDFNSSLPLNFTVSDVTSSVNSCWFHLNNGSNVTVANCLNTTFSVGGDGQYTLTLFANDSLGNLGSNNANFSVSTAVINISITEPSGTKSSRTSIPIDYSVVSGNNLSCWYYVDLLTGGNVVSNTTLANCSTSSFDVSTDGDFILTLYANNSVGEFRSFNSSFSVSTSGGTGGGSSGGGGGGSGGGGSFLNTAGKLTFEPIPSFIGVPGKTKRLSLGVKNSGLSFLNDCSLKGSGLNSDWIFSSVIHKIGGGESTSFDFSLDLPEYLQPSTYNLSIGINCIETSKQTSFSFEVIEEQIVFELISAERDGNSGIRVQYSLKDFSKVDQDVEIQFLLYDSFNEQVAELTEVVSLDSGSEEQFEVIIPVGQSLSGSFNLIVNLNSEEYSSFVQESLVLSKGVSGLAIFDFEGNRSNTLIFVFGALFLIFAVFMVVRIVNLRKRGKKTKDYSEHRHHKKRR